MTIPKGDNVPAGVIVAAVSKIGEILDDSGRGALCVHEDASPASDLVPENQAHAIIKAVDEYNDEDLLGFRDALWEIMKENFVPMADIKHKDD
ncbi:hypothetical protein [Rhodobacter viridis]|uniref:hypothetical protein n=1 Tax=Rhodobacter viridis TaxID=1054202 RepID=UPI0011B4FD9B|nr:hypothetical protein [Rhodobacter viridis]